MENYDMRINLFWLILGMIIMTIYFLGFVSIGNIGH